MQRIQSQYARVFIKIMEEEEGFEPPRGLTRLSVFKTDPFSQTWVFLQIYVVVLLTKYTLPLFFLLVNSFLRRTFIYF